MCCPVRDTPTGCCVKFFLDNNLPPTLAEAFNILIRPYEYSAIHLQTKFEPSTADIEWITTLSQEGDWAILTNDAFRQYKIERKALIESGLVVY